MTISVIVIAACTIINLCCWIGIVLASIKIRRNLKVFRDHAAKVEARAEEVRKSVAEAQKTISDGARPAKGRFKL